MELSILLFFSWRSSEVAGIFLYTSLWCSSSPWNWEINCIPLGYIYTGDDKQYDWCVTYCINDLQHDTCFYTIGTCCMWLLNYNDVIMSTMASQITSITIVCPTVNSGADQRKHQSSASLAFVRGIHRWPVNSPHKGPVTWKMYPFHDVIMANNPYISTF